MMTNQIKNFSVITYLTGEEYKKVRELQKALSDITGSRKCIEDWLPHATVGDGIRVSEEELPAVEEEFEKFASIQKNVTTSIAGFGGVENWKGAVAGKVTSYVIWLNVDVSPELLGLFNNLRDAIISKHETWLPRTITYIPHITLAFADLTKEGYDKGMAYLSEHSFESSLTISHVALTESYGEGNMTSVEYRKFYFESNQV